MVTAAFGNHTSPNVTAPTATASRKKDKRLMGVSYMEGPEHDRRAAVN